MMKILSVNEAKDRLVELAREAGDDTVIAVTKNGIPVFELEGQGRFGGIDLEAGRAFLHAKGIANPVLYIADDFDDPLPDDFLLKSFPGT